MPKIKLRNYHRYVSKETLEVLGLVEENEAQAQEMLQEVTQIERMYDRKVAKAVKLQLKNENEPLSCLRPSKANIDLKRGLETKLSQLRIKTDKSIL